MVFSQQISIAVLLLTVLSQGLHSGVSQTSRKFRDYRAVTDWRAGRKKAPKPDKTRFYSSIGQTNRKFCGYRAGGKEGGRPDTIAPLENE